MTTISDIRKLCASPMNDLEPVTNTDENYEKFKQYFEYNHLNINNLYTLKNNWLHPYWYVEPDIGLYVELYTNTIPTGTDEIDDTLEAFDAKKRIELNKHVVTSAINNKHYKDYFVRLPNEFRLFEFEKRYKDIPEENIYEIFEYIYTSYDFGFNKWNPELIDYCCKFSPKPEKDEVITIYRGQGNESTPITEAYSYTTDSSIATRFALMYGTNNSSIIKANIHTKDIKAYINCRDEHEVLVPYDALQNIQIISLGHYTQDNVISCIAPYLRDYGKIVNKYIEPLTNYYTSYIHGIGHIKRMMLLELILAKQLKLTPTDSHILQYCVTFHDIGRTTDIEDIKHGELSIDFIKEHKLTNKFGLTPTQLNMAYAIIKNHCINDTQGIENINNDNTIKMKKRTIQLYRIFKDIDNLDRIRTNDLDYKYLRHSESIKLISLANILFTGKFADITIP